jgi:hypothetical protein
MAVAAAGSRTRPHQVQMFKKSAPNGHYYLQRAILPDWMDGQHSPLKTYHGVFFKVQRRSFEDIT